MDSISIHIGLNKLNPSIYYGDSGALNACVNDAYAMAGIALSKGFSSVKLLINEKATCQNFIKEMDSAISSLSPGGILFLTFAGHGGQIPSKISPGDMDEVWCFFDGIIKDNDLCNYWAKLSKGIRVLLISDSCHSGGIVRFEEEGKWTYLQDLNSKVPISRGIQNFVFGEESESNIVKWETCKNGKPIEASIRLLSACDSHEKAKDGASHGAFTTALLKVWQGGDFKGNYLDYFSQISEMMENRKSQIPQHVLVGKSDAQFNNQLPFSI